MGKNRQSKEDRYESVEDALIPLIPCKSGNTDLYNMRCPPLVAKVGLPSPDNKMIIMIVTRSLTAGAIDCL